MHNTFKPYKHIESAIKIPEVEFLISTMNRTDLDFLNSIFKHYDLDELDILIINQTSKEKLLHSKQKNIRVINAFEKGLSRSRNLAIRNAIGELCFITDDDVEYLPNAINIAKQAYNDFPESALISFQYLRENDEIFKKYLKKSGYQNTLLHKQSISSIEVTICTKKIKDKGILFNTAFGLGARFKSSEEQVFRDDLIKAGLKVAFVTEPIVKHYGETSVAAEHSKAYTQALVAQKYLLHKNLIYVWLIRYIWLLLKRKVIKVSQITKIWNYGVEAVQDYKKCVASQY